MGKTPHLAAAPSCGRLQNPAPKHEYTAVSY